MDEIKKVDYDTINEIAAKHRFGIDLTLKDFYLSAILYLIKDVQGIYFKGGTALQKIFLNYSRMSEDIDFTLTKDVKEVIKEINKILEESKLFTRITKDKDVGGFTRLVAHYKGFSNEDGSVFIDLNQRAHLLMKPESHKINHFYKGNIPEFSFTTLAKEEMIAEKIAAAIGRNKPRDHYDIYRIIKQNIPINLDVAKKKCSQSNHEFNITKMFNRAKKLKNRWDADVLPLLAEEVSFQEVMATLAKHFKLKEEKERLKTKRKKEKQKEENS